MSRQSLIKAKGFHVVTKFPGVVSDRVFYVATEFGQDQGFFYRDITFLCRDRVGQGEEILCRDREFDVATELPEIALQQSIPYVSAKSSRT